MRTRGKPMRVMPGRDGKLDPYATIDGVVIKRIDVARRHPRDVWRDRLARDLERFLANGGAIDVLPGPGEGVSRKVTHGAEGRE